MIRRLFFEMPWPRPLWDATSRQFFDRATVRCDLVDPLSRLTASHLISLSGAPRQSEIHARVSAAGFDVTVHNALFDFPFTFVVVREGRRWSAKIDLLQLKNEYRHHGIGARMFILMVRAARRLGIRRLEGQELDVPYADGRLWSGALAAAKLGWDAELPASYMRSLPDYLGGAESLREIFIHPGGRDWWDRHPTSLRFRFDTSSGSPNVELLQTYALEHRIRLWQ
jgi:GNAT superfamily N-acetyltransferase